MNPPGLGSVNERFEFANSGVEQENVANHENPSAVTCQLNQFSRLGGRHAKRLFAEHMLASVKGITHHLTMETSWSGDNDRVNVCLPQHLVVIFVGLDMRKEATN